MSRTEPPAQRLSSDGLEKMNPKRTDTSYRTEEELVKHILHGWFDLRTCFTERAAILEDPLLMTRYPDITSDAAFKDFKSPLKFSIQCLGFYLVVQWAFTIPLQFFYAPVDQVNAAYVKWFISTLAKIQGIMVPLIVFVSSYIFSAMIFKVPMNPAVCHAKIIHMTYIQSILFWPNTILALLTNGLLFWAYYFTELDSKEYAAFMRYMDDNERPLAVVFVFVLFCSAKWLSTIFGTTKTHVVWAMSVSNSAGTMIAVVGYMALSVIFRLLYVVSSV
jgi:hypothetical protein